jgi:hypothetical protein
MSSQSSNKVVVFDLDETLGYFLEFGVFWDALLLYVKPAELLTQEMFNKILDLYPEFIRPNIFSVLKYLKRQKIAGLCRNVMIYTNNKGPPEWAHFIKNYIHDKLEYILFDQIIGAFKVNGQHIEICRTTNDKTKDDFIRCTKLPENIEICFIDNDYHPDMDKHDIYYIKLNTYIYALEPDIMINRLLSNRQLKKMVPNNTEFNRFILSYMRRYHAIYNIEKTPDDYDIDKIVTKQLMVLLQSFFTS